MKFVNQMKQKMRMKKPVKKLVMYVIEMIKRILQSNVKFVSSNFRCLMMLNHLKFTLVFVQVKVSTNVMCVAESFMMKLLAVSILKTALEN